MDAGSLIFITILFLSFIANNRGYRFLGNRRFYLCCSLALMCCPVSAEIYKWVDEKGHVHYGDRPVQGSTLLDTSQSALPVNTIPGLTAYERQKLQEIDQREQQQAREQRVERVREEKRQRAEESVAKQKQRKCRHYSNLMNRYRSKLRAGCSVKNCQDYKRKVKEYQAEVDDYCG